MKTLETNWREKLHFKVKLTDAVVDLLDCLKLTTVRSVEFEYKFFKESLLLHTAYYVPEAKKVDVA